MDGARGAVNFIARHLPDYVMGTSSRACSRAQEPCFISANTGPFLKLCSGRKRSALLYVLCYTLGCFTKHVPSFWVLFAGRILCGIATSLLYSVFESWVVSEHQSVRGCFLGGYPRGGGMPAHVAMELLSVNAMYS